MSPTLYTLVRVIDFENEIEQFLGVYDTHLKAVRAARRYAGSNKDIEFAIHIVELNDKEPLPMVPSYYITATKVEQRSHAFW